METAIRAALPQDYDQVERIMQQVNQLHVAWRPDVYRDAVPVMPKLHFMELIGRGAVLVCVCGEQIIGLISFSQRSISGGPSVSRKVLYIDSLAVLDGYRGMGVGHKLLDRVTQFAREEGFDTMELKVNARNEGAIRMYQNYGFRKESILMALPL